MSPPGAGTYQAGSSQGRNVWLTGCERQSATRACAGTTNMRPWAAAGGGGTDTSRVSEVRDPGVVRRLSARERRVEAIVAALFAVTAGAMPTGASGSGEP